MKYLVLGIGYSKQEYDIERNEWKKYSIDFHFADNIPQAAEELKRTVYVCVAIRSDCIMTDDLMALREIRAIPIVILPPAYTLAERCACIYFSAMQYVRTTGRCEIAESGGADSLRHYLDIPTGERKSLTIITVKDLCFCLEHRSVEVSGKEVELTEKEFDILALLIMNQRQVFTYEMIMDAIWHNDYAFYSRNALSTHISNLRRKLKVTPDVPDHIKSIRGIGYKFETQR